MVADRPKCVAKWGAACAPCAAAKAKCLRTNETPASKCDRCERLLKDCAQQVHRPRKKRAGKPSKTTQLEQRLNGLVDLLKASGELKVLPNRGAGERFVHPSDGRITLEALRVDQSSGTRESSSPDNDEDNNNDGPSDEDDEAEDDEDDDDDEAHKMHASSIRIPKHYNCFAPASCICRSEKGEIAVPPESDERVLAIYQEHLSPLYPFVMIPDGTTPEELETARPFLFSSIRMVTSLTSMRSMRAQMCRLMAYVAEHLLMRSERSLDLLQGLIVMIGWYHYHCLMHAQMGNLVHLAISVLTNLGLNQPPQLQERTRLMVLFPDEPTPRSNEERRALLGVWYLNSCISVGFGKTEPMRFSPYVQQCLRELHEAPEYETDIVLVHMVRIQRLSERIAQLHSDREEEVLAAAAEDHGAAPGIPRAPLSAYMSAFQTELDKIRKSLGQRLKDNKYIMLLVHSATLHLYEPPKLDAALLARFHKDLTNRTENTPSPLDLFYRAASALREWCDHWATIPVSSYFYVPMPICTQLIYAVIMLGRWAKLVSPIKPSTTSTSADNTAAAGEDAGTSVMPLPVPLTDPSTGHKYANKPTVPIKADQRVPKSSCTRNIVGQLSNFDATTTSRPAFIDDRCAQPSSLSQLSPAPSSSSSLYTNPPPTSSSVRPPTANTADTPAPTSTLTLAPSHHPSASMLITGVSVTAIPFQEAGCPANVVRWREPSMLPSDPQILNLIAAFREHLHSQPGLRIDVAAVLGQMAGRCEQASRDMVRASAGAEAEPNVWGLTAKKVLITRVKLERWAEAVTTWSGQSAEESSGPGGAVRPEDAQKSIGRGKGATGTGGSLGESQNPGQSWQGQGHQQQRPGHYRVGDDEAPGQAQISGNPDDRQGTVPAPEQPPLPALSNSCDGDGDNNGAGMMNYMNGVVMTGAPTPMAPPPPPSLDPTNANNVNNTTIQTELALFSNMACMSADLENGWPSFYTADVLDSLNPLLWDSGDSGSIANMSNEDWSAILMGTTDGTMS